jgi:hypothetical protein
VPGRTVDPFRSRARVVRIAPVLVFALALAVLPSPLRADEPRPERVRVNYVYATQFGFGGYEVGGLRVGVYTLPLGLTFDDVLASWDLELDVSVTYGRFRFSDTIPESGGAIRKTETNTIAAEPELQLHIPIPVVPGLRISPIGAFGFGTEFSTSDAIERDGVKDPLPTEDNAFYTYQIGLSALLRRDWRDFTFLFGNAYVYAGNAAFGESADDIVEGYGTFRTGVEARRPIGFRIADFVPDAGVFFVYHRFTPNLEFVGFEQSTIEIDEIFEIGGTVGVTESSHVSWLPGFLNRALADFSVGVGYQTGQGLEGFRLTFGFPF